MAAFTRRFAHEECGGGVGVIGMCFTGNFALSMMLEPSVVAPVNDQPSLPLDRPGETDSGPEELEGVRSRLDAEDLAVLAYRFQGDPFCRTQRFAAYSKALGKRFVGSPTTVARDEILQLFRERLLAERTNDQ